MMRAACTLLIGSLLAPALHAQQPASNLPRELLNYCSVRERTTEIMVEGRDKGVLREQVLERLPPLKADSTDAEIAAHSRLDDIYTMPRINAKTMAAHRFFGCLLQGQFAGKPPRFDKEFEPALFECQTAGGTAGDPVGCVRLAQQKHLLK